MGKNQTHKALSQSKHSGGGGGGGDAEGLARGEGVDASFHTAEWHAARLAALQVERPSWEDWKQKQKDEENKYDLILIFNNNLCRCISSLSSFFSCLQGINDIFPTSFSLISNICREQAALEEQERLMAEYKQGLEADREKRLGHVKERKKSSKEKKRKRSSHSRKESKKSSKDNKVGSA